MKKRLPKTLNEKKFASEITLFGKGYARKAAKKIFHCDEKGAVRISKELLDKLII